MALIHSTTVPRRVAGAAAVATAAARWQPWSVGALLGLGWSVAARAWMALVADDPEVTLAGTAFVIGGGTLVGLLLGTVEGRRRAGASRWWLLLAVPGLVHFAGAGLVLLPALLLGGFALSGRGPLWLRVPAGAGLLAPLGLLAALEGGLPAFPRTPWAAVAGLLVLSAGLAGGGSVLFRRWRRLAPDGSDSGGVVDRPPAG